MTELARYRDLPGRGAGGGLGAGLAALGAELVPGAELVLDLTGSMRVRRRLRLVVTGEGGVDATTSRARPPARCSPAAGAWVFAASCSAGSSRRASTRTRSRGAASRPARISGPSSEQS